MWSVSVLRSLALVAIIVIMAGSLLALLFGIRERPPVQALDPVPFGQQVRTALSRAYRLEARAYPDYTWLLVSRFLVLAGVYTVQGFAQFFIRDTLGAPNPARTTSHLILIIGAGTVALVYSAGYLSDLFGRKLWNTLAALVCSAGVFLLLTVAGYPGLYVAGALLGISLGSFLSTNWALATELVPLHEAGKYLGLPNLATAGAGAVARLAGPLIDLFDGQRARPSAVGNRTYNCEVGLRRLLPAHAGGIRRRCSDFESPECVRLWARLRSPAPCCAWRRADRCTTRREPG